MRIGEVACPVPLVRTFDYEVPESLRASARPGVRVQIPFGPRRVTGTLLGVREGEPSRALKPLLAVQDPEPLLGPEMLELARWLCRRYGAAPGDVCKALVPSYVRLLTRKGKASAPSEAGAETEETPPARAPFELTAGQAEAVERLIARLRGGGHETALLFGVPASGKTEVYIRLIREAVAAGGQALFLVPEISLTRPFFDDFERRAGLPVALWHSQVGAARRREIWYGVRRGEVRLVVGARSASLLPFKDLRLAVLDEEQDESYKQDDQAPHYHAREVVLERARRFGALAVLGSATPSLEALSLAEAGRATLVRMPERVARHTPPPAIHVVPPAQQPGRCLSDALVGRIRDRLSKREQVILLVNRRGHSSFLLCRKCGWVCRCPSCGIAWVLHQGTAKPAAAPEEQPALFAEPSGFHLLCHHCGRTAAPPPSCQGCKAGALSPGGAGTQRVVAELRMLLPGAKVLRMDGDTVSKERAQSRQDERMYDQFKAGKADVLVGTKLVAKGFHFPNVTLVGVVDADSMLHMPDFRAAERSLQLLIQVAGRAGRADKTGEVLVQSADPSHYAVAAVPAADYLAFARQELAFRRELGYPPARGLIRVLLSAPKEDAVRAAAERMAAELETALSDAEVVGPSPGVYATLRGKHRYHILVKVPDPARTDACLERVLRIEPPSGVKRSIQVDPYDLF